MGVETGVRAGDRAGYPPGRWTSGGVMKSAGKATPKHHSRWAEQFSTPLANLAQRAGPEHAQSLHPNLFDTSVSRIRLPGRGQNELKKIHFDRESGHEWAVLSYIRFYFEMIKLAL